MSTATAAARQVQGRKAIVRPASAPKPPARLRGTTTGAPVGRPTPSPQAAAPTGAGISATHLYLAEHMVSVLGELASLHETIAVLRGEVSALLRAPLSAAGVEGGARVLGLLSDAQTSAALLQDHSVMIASRLTGLEQRCNPVQQAVALAGLCAAGGAATGAKQSDATADAIESFNASELPAFPPSECLTLVPAPHRCA
jgi:hypothetical protein